MKFFLRYWLPIVAWLGVIFFGSTDLMSAEHTSRFIVPFLVWLKPDISPETLATIHLIVRKDAHVAEYAILGLLLLRAATLITNLRWSPAILCLAVMTTSLFVAVTDELHQTFVASRGPSATDILIDSSGAFFGLLIGLIFRINRPVKVEKAQPDC